MDDGELIAQVGPRIRSAPIMGGLLKRKASGRQAHCHRDGLVVEDKDGTIVLPHATTRVYATISPLTTEHDDPSAEATWTFVREDGVKWTSGGIKRDTALATVCDLTARASAEVRRALARERLASGEAVDFGVALVTAQDIVIHGEQSPLPWSEVTGIAHTADEPAFLSTSSRGELMLHPQDVADLAVLIALVEDRR